MTEPTYARGITEDFESALLSGSLKPIYDRVQNDDTLSLEIRNGYVDIYYRGGRLLGLHARTGQKGGFTTQFDERYFGDGEAYAAPRPEVVPPGVIETAFEAQVWVEAIAHYKQAMDIRFSLHPKLEREYQQSVVRDNNRHASGDSSDYVVVDIEYAQSAHAVDDQDASYRFDMVGFRWPAAGKTRASGLVTPVIMEMKAGDGALTSPRVRPDSDKLVPGLVKHVQDIERFLKPEPGKDISAPYQLLCDELLATFRTKQRLQLKSIPKRMRGLADIEIRPRPEVLFVLANHQPSSTILNSELKKLPPQEFADYRIATVTYAGYALFADNLKTIEQVIEETER